MTSVAGSDVTPADASAGNAFEALSDPNRRSLLELLRSGPRSVGELADEMPISRPAVSRHLRLLREAGLVREEPRGTRHVYRLHDEGLDVLQTYLLEVWGEAAARFRLVAENTSSRNRKTQP